MKSRVAAIAVHLPERVVTNAELEAEHPDWNMRSVAERAGVVSRHVAAPGETAFDLAAAACERLRARRIIDCHVSYAPG